jgi:Ca2+-binding EF-hand superfamily protein
MEGTAAAEEGVPPTAAAGGSDTLLAIPGIHALVTQRHAQRESSSGEALATDTETSVAHRDSLVVEYGAEIVSAVETEARSIFEQLDTERDGRLTLPEFAKALGQLGATSAAEGRQGLATYMFSAVDVDDSGGITLDEFVQWKLTMMHGSPQTKLRLGFNICDLNGDGTVNRAEVKVLLDSIFAVLSGLSLGEHNPEAEHMLDAIFKHSEDGDSLTWKAYCRACIEDKDMISHLGHERLSRPVAADSESAEAAATGAAAEAAAGEGGSKQKQMGSLTFFGQKRWEMMLSLMVGLQQAVEHTSSIDASDAAALTATWTGRQDTEDDDDGQQDGTEPVPERVYTIPSACDSHEAANDERCQQLVGAAVTVSAAATEALLGAAEDAELRPAIGRALASSLCGKTLLLKAISKLNRNDQCTVPRQARDKRCELRGKAFPAGTQASTRWLARLH